jgi:hydrogenase maturation factor
VSPEPERCLTCSDEAVTATVIEVEGANATVEADGRRERIGIELVEPVASGDVLLCHAGIALEKVSTP